MKLHNSHYNIVDLWPSCHGKGAFRLHTVFTVTDILVYIGECVKMKWLRSQYKSTFLGHSELIIKSYINKGSKGRGFEPHEVCAKSGL